MQVEHTEFILDPNFGINRASLWAILQVEAESHDCEEQALNMVDLLTRAGASVTRDHAGNVLAVKTAPDHQGPVPCVVAHLDTVHAVTGEGIAVVRIGDTVMGVLPKSMRQTGIGGDDKCGLYAALHCMWLLPSCKVALMVDEEIGCVGSSQVDLEFFDGVSFILEADRRGSCDFVTEISCDPMGSESWLKAVKPLLEKHGYRESTGMMTDVMELRDRGVGVSCANLSAGYHRPHTDHEVINLRQLGKACSLMMDISHHLGDTRWEHEHRPKARPRQQVAQSRTRFKLRCWEVVDPSGFTVDFAEADSLEEAQLKVYDMYAGDCKVGEEVGLNKQRLRGHRSRLAQLGT